jgi:hypothetical protein
MLEADDRRLLLESLRPPPGYRLDQAVGTTFTLDLVALLTTPMAFTLFEAEVEEDRPLADPVALLRAVREHGERITIFCQGGQISIPPHDQLLYANLEDSVYQVIRSGSLFHPKLWLLRFVTDDGPVVHRLLCLSRNLTFDRSWDAILSLDGEVASGGRPEPANEPLADFLRALPGLKPTPSLPKARADRIRDLAEEVRRVEFQLPPGCEELRFCPLGITGHRAWPFGAEMDRMLVISPFLGDEAVARLLAAGDENVIVSRPESFDRIADRSLLSGVDARVMDDLAVFELGQDAAAPGDVARETTGETLRGLHAKVYAADRGSRASLWVGSANATGAGLGASVEMLVELQGDRRRFGVDAVLEGDGSDNPFGRLLKQYDVDAEPPERDLEREELERDVEQLQLSLAREKFLLSVDGPDADGKFVAELLSKERGRPVIPAGMKVSAWPITLNPGVAKTVLKVSDDQVLARFSGLTATTLTPFVAFQVEGARAGARHESGFVVRVPMRGAPAGRHQDVLKTLLSDRERILRYLLMILAETRDATALAPDLLDILGRQRNGAASGRDLGVPLLEGMLRALDRDERKLEQVAKLMADLGEHGEAVLPAGFRDAWEPIWDARRKRRRR